MRRTLIALLLLASPLLAQAPNGWQPIENGWAEIQTTAPTGTVTTTGTLASGQVALGSGATSITGDAGLTYSGTGPTFKLFGTHFVADGAVGSGNFAFQNTGGGAGLYFDSNSLMYGQFSAAIWGFRGGYLTGSSGSLLCFSSTSSATGPFDACLSRASAGLLLVEDGSGAARDLQARTGTFGTSVVTPVVSGGVDSATPNATFFTGTGSRGGTDTNVAGGNLTIRPGAGTGSATGSSIVFQTPTATGSGTTGQTQTTRLSIAEGHFNVAALPVYANNAAAVGGGLVAGDLYRTNADPDPVCVVH